MQCRFLSVLVLAAVLLTLAVPVLAGCLGCENGMPKMTCAKNNASHAVYAQVCCCSMRGLPKAATLPEAIVIVNFELAGIEVMPVTLDNSFTVRAQSAPVFFRHFGASQFSSPKHSISILKQSFLI